MYQQGDLVYTWCSWDGLSGKVTALATGVLLQFEGWSEPTYNF